MSTAHTPGILRRKFDVCNKMSKLQIEHLRLRGGLVMAVAEKVFTI
jgi:hypothetical protein